MEMTKADPRLQAREQAMHWRPEPEAALLRDPDVCQVQSCRCYICGAPYLLRSALL